MENRHAKATDLLKFLNETQELSHWQISVLKIPSFDFLATVLSCVLNKMADGKGQWVKN